MYLAHTQRVERRQQDFKDYAYISLLNVYCSLGNNQLSNVCNAQAIITKMRCITFITPANS